MAGPGRAPSGHQAPPPGPCQIFRRCWLKLLKDLPQHWHHDAIIFLIIFGHVSLALILQLPGTAGAGPARPGGQPGPRQRPASVLWHSYWAQLRCSSIVPRLDPSLPRPSLGWFDVHAELHGRFKLPARGSCRAWAVSGLGPVPEHLRSGRAGPGILWHTQTQLLRLGQVGLAGLFVGSALAGPRYYLVWIKL